LENSLVQKWIQANKPIEILNTQLAINTHAISCYYSGSLIGVFTSSLLELFFTVNLNNSNSNNNSLIQNLIFMHASATDFTADHAVQRGCNLWDCRWNPSVWPFKWKLTDCVILSCDAGYGVVHDGFTIWVRG